MTTSPVHSVHVRYVIFSHLQQTGRSNNLLSSKRLSIDFDNPAKELFYWAILFNRRELAYLFWKSGKDQIGKNIFCERIPYVLMRQDLKYRTCPVSGGALIASALLKALSKVAERDVEIDLSLDMLEHSK